MILLSLMNSLSICMGLGIAALTGYPLFWGLLAGWLCPAVALMLVMLPYLMIQRIEIETHRHRHHPLRRSMAVNRAH